MRRVQAFCGIDWASDHHDIAVVDETGSLLARARIDDSAEGFDQLLQILAEHDDSPQDLIPVAIETSRGLLVACLRATGRPVYAINPMAAARYRDRHTVSRKKSDHLDAMVLANILRTDAAAHRMLPADSEVAQAVAVLARAQQDAVWDRTQAGNKLTSHLREYFPSYLAAVGHRREGIYHPIARALLEAAPTPREAAKLTRPQLRAVLKKAGRKNTIDREVERLHSALRAAQMHHLPLVEEAMGRQAMALRCSGSWNPRVRARMISPRPRCRRSRHMLMPRSSPVFQGWVPSAELGFWPRSATTGLGSPTPKV